MGRSETVQAWGTAIAAVAAIAAAIFAFRANSRADEANDIAERANEIAGEANEMVAGVAVEQRAREVYLGEAPTYVVDDHPLPAGENVWIVVMNESGTQINGVWVEGEGGATIKINGVENCSMYALDPTVDPVAVHYRDASGKGWRRTWDGVTDDYGAYPNEDTHDSPWGPVTIEDCSA